MKTANENQNQPVIINANNSVTRKPTISDNKLSGRHGLHPKDKALDALVCEYEDREVTITCPDTDVTFKRSVGASMETVTIAVSVLAEAIPYLLKQELGQDFQKSWFDRLRLFSAGVLQPAQLVTAGLSCWETYRTMLEPFGFTDVRPDKKKGQYIVYKSSPEQSDVDFLESIGWAILGAMQDTTPLPDGRKRFVPEIVGFRVTIPD